MKDFQNERNQKIFAHNWASLGNSFQVELRKKKRQNFVSSLRCKPKDSDYPMMPQKICLNSLLSDFKFTEKDTSKSISVQLVNFSYQGQSEVDSMLDCGIIEFCLANLTRCPKDISEDLLLTLSNIAATGDYYRSKIIKSGYLKIIPSLIFNGECRVGFMKTFALSLRNTVQVDVKLDTLDLSLTLQMVSNLISLDFPKINLHCFFVIKALVIQGYVKEIIKHLDFIFLKAGDEQDLTLMALAVDILLNIVLDSEQFVSDLMDKGIVELVQANLSNKNPMVLIKTLLVLSNLLESTAVIVKKVFRSQIFIQALPCLSHENIKVKTIASSIFASICRFFRYINFVSTFKLMYENHLFQHIIESFSYKSSEIISNIVTFLKLFLDISQLYFPISREEFYDSGLYDALELATLHTNSLIGQQINSIISIFDSEISNMDSVTN